MEAATLREPEEGEGEKMSKQREKWQLGRYVCWATHEEYESCLNLFLQATDKEEELSVTTKKPSISGNKVIQGESVYGAIFKRRLRESLT